MLDCQPGDTVYGHWVGRNDYQAFTVVRVTPKQIITTSPRHGGGEPVESRFWRESGGRVGIRLAAYRIDPNYTPKDES
jgi:hypothetical protein